MWPLTSNLLPWGASKGIKGLKPVLVKAVRGVIDLKEQTIMHHVWHICKHGEHHTHPNVHTLGEQPCHTTSGVHVVNISFGAQRKSGGGAIRTCSCER